MKNLTLGMKCFSFFTVSSLFLAQVIAHAPDTYAADCIVSACIDVYTLDGQIIIEGRKGSGATASAAPTPRATRKPTVTATVKPTVKPTVKATVAPTPATTSSVQARPTYRPTRKALPRKIVPKAKVTPATSLNDRLVKLLPTAEVLVQPSAQALIKVPTIFWCDLPAVFTTKVAIVGEVVDVTMKPSFLWSFGDGTFFLTTSAGAPYPHQKITHTYQRPGKYIVTMIATWGGVWGFNGITRAITGEIHMVSMKVLSVAAGPIRITQ
ncbi:MAG: PKD domain-containing protein [Actinobacteria bacterium]|uniref:Unannotated protein n=1 Tax=freshwater metagenome TaxID=449393 RepID=A0A6J7H4C0_9ZZZZ|nr:PKD domain-containing protein [Actinomycetota bacterium]MSW47070.1 PKD domain-containing protein [Actinomycetota bacterium]MSX24557.1 PKD domain-containing protein [Actinomycetota bacterium]MSY46811.1 PKD domain-containing protein [Actinomycetota bacterium]MSY56942.1 PKD domain-containing protein [Actinomycetota bacterium]